VLDKSEVVLHSADAFAPVGILHTRKFHLEAKAPTTGPASDQSPLQNGGLVDMEHGLDVAGAEIIVVEDEAPCAEAPNNSAESGDSQKRQASAKAEDAPRSDQHRQEGQTAPGFGARVEEREVRVEVEEVASDGVLRIRCSHDPTSSRNSEQASLFEAPEATAIQLGAEAMHIDADGSQPPKSEPGSSATRAREGAITPELSEAAVRSLLTSAESELTARGSTWADVIYVYLFLAEMGHFARANAAYKEVITEEKCACGGGVPSRSTVQVELPPGCAARVEVLVAVENSAARSTESAGELGAAQRSGEGAEESAPNGGKAAGSSPRPGGRSSENALEEGNVNGFTEEMCKEDESGGGATVGTQGRGGGSLEGQETEEPSGGEGSIEMGRGALEFQKDGGASGAAKVGGAEIKDAHSKRKRHSGGGKKVLHVQSISSWAPSCIGPYSQVNISYFLRFFLPAGVHGPNSQVEFLVFPSFLLPPSCTDATASCLRHSCSTLRSELLQINLAILETRLILFKSDMNISQDSLLGMCFSQGCTHWAAFNGF
jgi:enamine deaminase RidA (YjgF/YER057c/UK114 family)